MTVRNRYNDARELIRQQILQLEGLLESLSWMETNRVSPEPIIQKLGSATERPQKPSPTRRRIGGRREPTNPGETWAQAINMVLIDAEKALTVNEIVERLEARGRAFPEGRRDSPVRATLARSAAHYGWQGRGRPKRWKKKTSEQEVEPARLAVLNN